MKSASYQSADARRRGDFFGHARGSFSAAQGIDNTTDSVALRGLGHGPISQTRGILIRVIGNSSG
jgi:hypothetical protein